MFPFRDRPVFNECSQLSADALRELAGQAAAGAAYQAANMFSYQMGTGQLLVQPPAPAPAAKLSAAEFSCFYHSPEALGGPAVSAANPTYFPWPGTGSDTVTVSNHTLSGEPDVLQNLSGLVGIASPYYYLIYPWVQIAPQADGSGTWPGLGLYFAEPVVIYEGSLARPQNWFVYGSTSYGGPFQKAMAPTQIYVTRGDVPGEALATLSFSCFSPSYGAYLIAAGGVIVRTQ